VVGGSLFFPENSPEAEEFVAERLRRLVKDRMELTGMRWRTEGAQAMLSLRAAYLNGDWDEFQQARRSKERDKLYFDRELIMAEWPEAA